MLLAMRFALLLLLLLPTAVGAEDDTFVSSGVKIHYRVQGEGDPVVLFITAGQPEFLQAVEEFLARQPDPVTAATTDRTGRGETAPSGAGARGLPGRQAGQGER
jgi:hypothetical protein